MSRVRRGPRGAREAAGLPAALRPALRGPRGGSGSAPAGRTAPRGAGGEPLRPPPSGVRYTDGGRWIATLCAGPAAATPRRMTPRALAPLAVLLLVAGAAALFVRLAPSGPEWHVDPERDGRTGPGRWLVAEGGDAPALRLPAPPPRALEAFDAVATAEGARRLVWAPEEGRATYVDRSRVVGFPDYVSVSVLPEGDGSRLSAYSRLRFGRDDFGVNRARLERWAARLEAMLGA